MRATWYLLEDGTPADPREVAPDKSGVLRNKAGIAVATRADGNPSTSGVDVDESGKALSDKRKTKDASSPQDREVKAEEGHRGKYKTR